MDDGISRGPILVVDDDEDYRLLLREQLEALGYQVLEAGDGSRVAGTVGQEHPPLVVLDLVMPGAEGLETIGQLRRQQAGVKILAISGADEAGVYLRIAARFGADATFEKTRPVGELLSLVQKLLEDRGLTRHA